ncbi:MAG TPA: sugar ABC transporter permease [Streptosporangiaceae bacterium]|nr:sugar ABC transporter permease [Streptosporangiaceae bacterium]
MQVTTSPRTRSSSYAARVFPRDGTSLFRSPGILFVLPSLALFATFVGYPLFHAVYLSLTSSPGFGPATFVGGRNFQVLWGDPVFWQALRDTAIFTVAGTVLQTVVPLAVALLLREGWRGALVLRTIYFIPSIVSLTVSGLLWQLALAPNFGPVNQVLQSIGLGSLARPWLADSNTVVPMVILVSLWQSFGFMLLIFHAGLQNIDPQLYEAARIDGASKFREAWSIAIPLLRPVTELVVMINVISGLQIFDVIYTMTGGGPIHASESLSTYLYSLSFGNASGAVPAFGYSAAIGLVLFVLTALVTFTLYRLRKSPEE